MTEEDVRDAEFMNGIICSICDYAVDNGMKPDETIKIISENLLALLEITTFNNWKKSDK